MNEPRELLPPTAEIREKLARNIRERRVLRGLLRLATMASEPIGYTPALQANDRPEGHGHRAACA